MNSDSIKSILKQVGFSEVGITTPALLSREKDSFEQYLDKGLHGEMDYLEKNLDIRENIKLLLPSCQSVIVTLLNYYPENPEIIHTPLGKVSKYAVGTDYHFVIQNMFRTACEKIMEIYPHFESRHFTDSAPIFERQYAQKAGLGWLGKHSLLISPQKGSFFFIGIMLTNLKLTIDNSFGTSHCGSCSACIDACPTHAIIDNGVVDASKCISYATIEYKSEQKPDSITTDGWIWGCDICQDVCPWNKKFSKPNVVESFQPNPKLQELNLSRLSNMSEREFRRHLNGSPLIRRGKKGILRNYRWQAEENSLEY